MRLKTYRVFPRNGGWGCKLSGAWIVVSNAANLLDKETYVAAVRRLAKQNQPSRVIVYNRDGGISK